MKTAPLTWNVYTERWGKGIEIHNIFYHGSFWADLCKIRKKYGKLNATDADRREFEREVKRHLAYYYWGKCEWEVTINATWHTDIDRERRVDVYEQVMNNWNPFINYLWENRMKLKGSV